MIGELLSSRDDCEYIPWPSTMSSEQLSSASRMISSRYSRDSRSSLTSSIECKWMISPVSGFISGVIR